MFDNPRREDGTRLLNLDFDEVSVGRRLFRDGTSGLKAIAPADLRIVATDAWIAEDGTRQVDTATRLLSVPPRPAFLNAEAPP